MESPLRRGALLATAMAFAGCSPPVPVLTLDLRRAESVRLDSSASCPQHSSWQGLVPETALAYPRSLDAFLARPGRFEIAFFGDACSVTNDSLFLALRLRSDSLTVDSLSWTVLDGETLRSVSGTSLPAATAETLRLESIGGTEGADWEERMRRLCGLPLHAACDQDGWLRSHAWSGGVHQLTLDLEVQFLTRGNHPRTQRRILLDADSLRLHASRRRP